VGFRTVVSILMVVDLPAPFGPRKAKIEPVSTSKLMSFTAVKSSNFFVRDLTESMFCITGPDMFFMGKIELISFSLKNPELHRFRKNSVKSKEEDKF
jgi:hypothetical protein